MIYTYDNPKKSHRLAQHFITASRYLPALLVLVIALTGSIGKVYSQESSPDSLSAVESPALSLCKAEELIRFGKSHLGRPYRFRNPRGEQMDCSGFLRYIFSEQGIALPRTGADMGVFSTRISYAEIRPGDLLFFRGRSNRSAAVGHVAVVTERNGDNLKMLHSCQRGVVIDDYPAMAYYRNRFLYAGRIPALFEGAFPQAGSTPDSLDASTPAEGSQSRLRSIIGVGDIMLGSSYPSAAYLSPCDGAGLLQPVHSILQNADLTFGNLEGVLLSGRGNPKTCANPANCFAFKSPDHYAGHLKAAGFDLLSLANNHVGDFGTAGKNNTMRVLRNEGLEFAGLREHPRTVFVRDGITYGFCAFAPFYSTARMNDYGRVRRIVRELSSEADIVIVSFHGGGEGRAFRHLTRRREHYLGEDRGNPYEFARVAIDAGADIVFGHGPHVSRSIDLYRGKFIAYSLGNFATYGRFNLRGSNGVAPIIKVQVDEQGDFVEAQIFSIHQPGRGGPVPDPENRALQEIIQLTRSDFPRSPLHIRPDGRVLLASSGQTAMTTNRAEIRP